MPTIRQTNGLSGFTKRSESEFDCFGAGHSSTTISAGLGNWLLTLRAEERWFCVRVIRSEHNLSHCPSFSYPIDILELCSFGKLKDV